jgi:hypothetical protein
MSVQPGPGNRRAGGAQGSVPDLGRLVPADTKEAALPKGSQVEYMAQMQGFRADELRSLGKRMLFALVGNQTLHTQACQEQFGHGEKYLTTAAGKHRSDADDPNVYTEYVRTVGNTRCLSPVEFRDCRLRQAENLLAIIEHCRTYPPRMPHDREFMEWDRRKIVEFTPMSNQGGGHSILYSSSTPITHPMDLVNCLAGAVQADIEYYRRDGHPMKLEQSPHYQALRGIQAAAKEHMIDLVVPGAGQSSEVFIGAKLAAIETGVASLPRNKRRGS